MRNFQIVSNHTIYVDSFNEGEQEQVNYYELSANIKAETPQKAIEQYFGKNLYYHFNIKDSSIDDEKENVLYYSTLVDGDNSEAFENCIELWKEGQKKLFSNQIRIEIQELKPVKI